MPTHYAAMMRHFLKQKVRGIDACVLSGSLSNDLGLAVANTLAAARARAARQVECTINGIGERAGNTALEEVVMLQRIRGTTSTGFSTGINTKLLYPIGAASWRTSPGRPVQPQQGHRRAENAFAHEAGIHQDGMLKERSTYEIMKPEDVGIPRTELVLGKHSGRHALKQRVTDLGYRLTDEQLNRVFEEFKNLADKKKEIYDADIEALAENQLQAGTGNMWALVGFTSTAGTGSQTSAAVTLRNQDGTIHRDAAVGNGPIDALLCHQGDQPHHQRAGEGDRLPRSRSVSQDMDALHRRSEHRDRTRRQAVPRPRGEPRRGRGQRAGVPGSGQPRRVAPAPRPSQAHRQRPD